MRPSLRPRLWLLGLAVPGVVLGHTLAYALQFPNHVHRAHHLTATGHAYWWLAVAGGLAFGVLAVGVVATSRLQARQARREVEPILVPRLAPRLGAIQLLVFLALEVVERLVSSAGGVSLGLLVSGTLAQAVVALAVTVALAWLARFVLHARVAGPGPGLSHQRPLFATGSAGSALLVLRAPARPVGSRAPPRRR